MLDNETKRRIDTARDILVGKLPDPKSQVEQITIALIYKFMDDMDAESVSFGGEPSFFVGDYEKYGWRKLLDLNLSGFETLALYGEAMTKLHENKNLPQLFRDIFKNAYLPYRDPETLKLFLKTINGFTYDHSERLGDAFEYLLSVLGSQGDAGQFRTPRHIIDFIVKILDPQKTETISDPACGTAGFLISAYKHILAANQNLTPDERKRLMTNFAGYDISPDMVRLSLVNMYLHGFPAPHIYEYDSLTSEDRWSETFDIVMANPPFMSPKGGIKPHKKFSINANRSEVLFVDYIAEHIHPTHGRAGIIVPEGIIFQSAGAYRDLRKMLVDKAFLYAVVSLPAGVFQPYSGVKTSVLLMDKTLAGKTDKILFVKIQNDGFGLGAQRREQATSDLPDALKLIRDFQAAVLQGDDSRFAGEDLPLRAVAIGKTQIAANGDYNLSGDRYKTAVIHNHKFDLVELGNTDLFQIDSGGTLDTTNPNYWNGNVNWATLVDLPAKDFITEICGTERKISEEGLRSSSAKLVPKNSIIVSSRATIGRIGINRTEIATNQGFKNIVIKDENKVSPEFVAFMLTTLKDEMELKASGGTFKEISKTNFCTLKIPLPPLSIQKEIVEKIEGFQRIIDGAKQVVENYKPQIDISPDWEMVELGEVCEVNPKKSELNNTSQQTLVSFVPMADLNENEMDFSAEQTKQLSEVFSGYTYFKDNDVLLAKVTPCFENGKAGIAKNLENGIGFSSSEYYVFRCGEKVLPVWIYLLIIDNKFREIGKNRMTGTGGLQRVPKDYVQGYQIPLPSLKIQQEIVTKIEREQYLVKGNEELITIFEQKIKDEINKLWEE